ncbi:MAG: YeeE/YedE family protein [Gammaproteobacteria bacterium]|nr:YeeE/YedE family protein [Gammaproteobacteria bacterium]
MWTQFLLSGFGLALVLGAVAHKTNFCTMGAVSDWVNMGDTGRMRAWLLAIFTAMLGVMVLEATMAVDMTMTANNAESFPPVRTGNFVWLRHLLGGLIFGVGMTLASGCGNKTLVRIGGGNLKSGVVFLAIAFSAYIMVYTNFDYVVFLQWMEPLGIDLTRHGGGSQELGSIIAGMFGASSGFGMHLLLGGIIVTLVLPRIFTREFLATPDNVIAGIVIGLLVVSGWYVSAGPLGQALLEEAAFMDQRPQALGAQSFTFVAPASHFLHYLGSGFETRLLTFALMVGLGVAVGSFAYAMVQRSFRFEWFADWRDFAAHLAGGLLMGVGGVLGLGCTFGQAITGTSTLAVGSFVTFGGIVYGAALTMKIQYYAMLYEDAPFKEVALTALVEMRTLPRKYRRLEAL